MSVYSHQFVCEVLSSSNLTLYTVPAGYVVVIRDIEVGDRSGAVNNQSTVFATSGGTIEAVVFSATIPLAYGWTQWTGRAVLNAGQSIGAGVSLAQGLLISGYLLVGP